ncbi:hypothetical protein PPYR_12775 [Photinus pyralis]|uniref:DDE Tnp4 domain-containing protein n=1 Tax=Photinus pyralis TaxID=7054 RepID=A0A5N4A772_PHOPY|nr:hypothetical protein PPYR_12775 [Photinus pyralis]
MKRVRQGFFNQYGFPGIVECIDCTHVAIVPPPSNDEEHPEHLYVNRKSYHSINVQLICDAQLRIMNVNARFPGSTNDSYIWNQTVVQALLRNIHGRRERDYFLLDAVDGTPEAHYNVVHKSTRATVERCNGVLKARFRCLLKHRVLQFCITVLNSPAK